MVGCGFNVVEESPRRRSPAEMKVRNLLFRFSQYVEQEFGILAEGPIIEHWRSNEEE